MDTRLEIFRDGIWRELRLQDNTAIKYNKVINRIGNTDSRQISHTNTFSLPTVSQNIIALDMNTFNPRVMAKSLNSKYLARYYVEDRIFQTGYLVINNTNNNSINVNFIDEALFIVDKWGSTTFRELLQDETLTFPADYVTAIAEMRDYILGKTSVATPLSEVGTRGYNLALFPNTLNAIGDKFQKQDDETRLADSFNPYQSRPIFNAKAFFELIVYAYGYTPVFDSSVDWNKVAKTYIVNEGLGENYKGGDGENYSYDPTPSRPSATINSTANGGGFDVSSVPLYPSSRGLTPNDCINWIAPDLIFTVSNYLDERCIFYPDLSENFLGNISYLVQCATTSIIAGKVFGVWNNSNPANDVVFKELTVLNEGNGTGFVTFSVSKTDLDSAPVNGGEFKGVIAYVTEVLAVTGANTITSTTVTETKLPNEAVSYDEFGQYLTESIDLTYAAPSSSIKSLLSSLMQKEGILLNVNNVTKEVKFFNYAAYNEKVKTSDFYDWSKYHQKYIPAGFNTDYGTNYAQKNKIGLSSPYTGNTFEILLKNQNEENKYKESAEDYVKNLKDISAVNYIGNPLVPYFEYTNLGLGLVELTNNIGSFTQVRADGTPQGTIASVANVANVNYSSIPQGVAIWYYIIDLSVRASAKFLLPTFVVKNLDLSKPVYINDLGGFYIIEEVSEYVDRSTVVEVKLIKLLNVGDYSDDFSNDFNN